MASPRWREIAEDLQRRIRAGEFSGADPEQQRAANQLPTEARLQEHYGDSRNTVRQAIDHLAGRGIVVKQAGRGTFVVEQLKRFVSNLTVGSRTETVEYHEGAEREGRKANTSEPKVEIKAADEWQAATLNIKPGESVVVRHQRRYIDERPFSLQTSFYPMSFARAGAEGLLEVEDIPRGAMAYLKDQLGIEESGTVDRISARSPTPGEVEFFRLPDVGDVAMLVRRRTTFDHDGNPIRVTVTTYPADRNEFEFLTGDVPPRPA